MGLFNNNPVEPINKYLNGYCYPLDKQQFANHKVNSLIVYKFHVSGTVSTKIKFPPNTQEFPNMWIVRR